ncbi:hypothetical protein CXB49_19125 [Chromobacterium sp. ATCC 53434]|nr:hypothetical protein CXB49_19125 [Chromobacterium sp. ATCC 53434]
MLTIGQLARCYLPAQVAMLGRIVMLRELGLPLRADRAVHPDTLTDGTARPGSAPFLIGRAARSPAPLPMLAPGAQGLLCRRLPMPTPHVFRR